MKNIFNNIEINKSSLKGIEELSITELLKIRGGNSDDKTKTKETDIYDTRDT